MACLFGFCEQQLATARNTSAYPVFHQGLTRALQSAEDRPIPQRDFPRAAKKQHPLLRAVVAGPLSQLTGVSEPVHERPLEEAHVKKQLVPKSVRFLKGPMQ